MIRTIIFDFGNVLAFFDHQRAIEKLRPYTTLAPAELMLILYGGELEVAYERGQISTERYFAIVKEDGRLTCDQSIFVDAFVNIFTENTAVTSLVPKLAERYRLLLASNTNEAHCTRFRSSSPMCCRTCIISSFRRKLAHASRSDYTSSTASAWRTPSRGNACSSTTCRATSTPPRRSAGRELC